MKKIVLTILASITMFFAGCDYNETAALAATKTAGTLACSAWFAIDDPGPEVKENVVKVIDVIKSVTVTNSTYSTTVYPIIVKYVSELDKLTEAQKQLINSGSLVILNGIDLLFIEHPEMAESREIERKFVNAFCDGCLIALKLPDTDNRIKISKDSYKTRCAIRNKK